MLEGYNANQVVRCVHLNEWERDFECRRAWGIMVAPRMVVPLLLLAVALGVLFQSSKIFRGFLQISIIDNRLESTSFNMDMRWCDLQ